MANRSKCQETRVHGGQLEWRKDAASPWLSAVRHKDVREQMLSESSYNGSRGYRYGRKEGPHAHDKTSLVDAQQTWGTDRGSTWPEILYAFKPGILFENSIRPALNLRWRGALVLDHHDEPITDFPGLPMTISSEVECEFIEAWTRSNRTLTLRDILARIPPATFGISCSEEKAVTNKMSMRVQRFRKINSMITWAPKYGSKEISKHISDWLKEEYPDAYERNSIRGIPAPAKDVVRAIQNINAGTRAGKRKVLSSEGESSSYDEHSNSKIQPKRPKNREPESIRHIRQRSKAVFSQAGRHQVQQRSNEEDASPDTVPHVTRSGVSCGRFKIPDLALSTFLGRFGYMPGPLESRRSLEDLLAFGDPRHLSRLDRQSEQSTSVPPECVSPCETQHRISTLALYLDPGVQPLWMPPAYHQGSDLAAVQD